MTCCSRECGSYVMPFDMCDNNNNPLCIPLIRALCLLSKMQGDATKHQNQHQRQSILQVHMYRDNINICNMR